MTRGGDSRAEPSAERIERSRSYLLGQMPADERQAFELELLSDPSLVDATEAAEEALLLDCLHDRLTADERRLADQNFLDQSRRAELDMLRVIARPDSRPTGSAEKVARPVRWLPRAGLALAATVLLAVGSAIGWFAASRWQQGVSVRTIDVGIGTVRDQGGATEFLASTSRTWTRLRLPLPPPVTADDVLRVEVRAAGGDPAEPTWIRYAVAERDGDGTLVVVDVPSRLLVPGDYFIRVTRRSGAALEPILETAMVVR